ncbi:hypothetical protein GJ496_001045 [Pomphorhynchus laevis]|nr:hypothetical protein GJ496_001045 [Pomphorhynchus laevis]
MESQCENSVKINTMSIICAERSFISGNVTINAKNVIHPWVIIQSEGNDASITINEGNLIEEKCTIHAQNKHMTIGRNNWFQVGAKCFASNIGDGCILESGSYVGSKASLADNCIIGAGCVFDPDQEECLQEGIILQPSRRYNSNVSHVQDIIHHRDHSASLLKNTQEIRRV